MHTDTGDTDMVSIAAKNLLHDRTRVAVSAGGVGFSIMLVLILAGTYDGFYRQAGLFTENSGADLFVGQAGPAPAHGGRPLHAMR